MGIWYCCGFGSNERASATANLSSEMSQQTSKTTITTNSTTWSSNGESQASEEAGPGQMLPHPNLKIFNFGELRAATRNFKSDMVLGEGGFGKVYKGVLDDKSFIAVKKLSSESLQGLQEWQAEVKFLGRLSHKNLVKLLGYCYEGSELLLVYEYMQKGSLENHLFGKSSILPWDVRVKISIGAAQGLAFLHSSDKHVIYRDFKTSNILLDGLYNAKISDFGLAKMGPEGDKSHVTTRVMGTYGYVAPEYINTGHLYVNSDVYGFGVVLVEMLTGMRAVDDTRPLAKQNLVEWAKPFLGEGRKLKNIMDPRLNGKYSSKAASKIAQIALTCLEPEPKTRPSMDQVAESLQRLDLFLNAPHSPYRHHSPQFMHAP